MIDPDWLEALQRGDAVATDRFYREHARQVLGWAIRLGGPRLDPEDVAQEVFSIALGKIRGFRGDSAVSTWLFVITRNVIANARRRAAIRRIVGFEADMDEHPHQGRGADEDLDLLRRRRVVQRALEALSRSHREVLVLMDLEGRTAPEVGELLSIPEGTAYSRLYYARRSFKQALQEEGVTSVLDVGLPVPDRRRT